MIIKCIMQLMNLSKMRCMAAKISFTQLTIQQLRFTRHMALKRERVFDILATNIVEITNKTQQQ